MSVNLKNLEAERLLHALAAATGESLTEAATAAFRERLERLEESRARTAKRSLASLLDLVTEARAAGTRDSRSNKQIRDELWGEE